MFILKTRPGKGAPLPDAADREAVGRGAGRLFARDPEFLDLGRWMILRCQSEGFSGK